MEWSHPGFDAGDLSENASDDIEGLNASAAHIANLLSTEPPNSKFSVCLDHLIKYYLYLCFIKDGEYYFFLSDCGAY